MMYERGGETAVFWRNSAPEHCKTMDAYLARAGKALVLASPWSDVLTRHVTGLYNFIIQAGMLGSLLGLLRRLRTQWESHRVFQRLRSCSRIMMDGGCTLTLDRR